MKYLKILAIILFVSNGLMAQQTTTYYMRITDYFVYTIQEDSINGLQITSNVSAIDEIFNRSNIQKFIHVFPDATDWANEIYYVVAYNENLKEELNREEFKQYISSISKLDPPTNTLRADVISNTTTFWQQGNYLVFDESINLLRTINFYSVTGAKIFSMQSTENKINPSLHLMRSGIYIVEIIESGRRYSGYYINR